MSALRFGALYCSVSPTPGRSTPPTPLLGLALKHEALV